jgi:tetratricopeptide (TPR) repeat protein
MLKTVHYNISYTDSLPNVIDFPVEFIEGLTEKLTINDNGTNLNDVFKWVSLGKETLEKYDKMSNPEIQKLRSALAWVLFDMSEYEMVLKIANTIIKSSETVKKENNELVSSYYRLLSSTQNRCGDYKNALENINKAVIIDKNNYNNYAVMGDIFINKNEFENAENALMKSLEKSIKKNGEDAPQTASVYQSYSYLYWQTRQENKYFEYAEKAHKIMKRHLGEENLYTVRCSCHLGICLFYKCRYKEAFEKMEKSDKILVKVFGEKHKETIDTKENIGRTLVKMYDYSRAFNYFENLLFITGDAGLLLVLSYCGITMYAPELVCIINDKQISDKIILNNNIECINNEQLANGIYNECELFDVIPEKYWKEVAGIYAKQMVTKKRYIRT